MSTSTNTLLAIVVLACAGTLQAQQQPAELPGGSASRICSAAPTSLPPLTVTLPTLPRCTVPSYPAVTGRSIALGAGGDFQAALNSASCGDEIVLAAGATFIGNYTAPVKSCTGGILVRSSQIGQLPPWTRVQQSAASLMPTIATPNSNSVLMFAPAASGWYFAGINFTVQPGVQGLWNLILLSAGATQVSQLPHDITFDRVLVHGNDQYCTRGFMADAVRFALMNSQVWDFRHISQDTQALDAINTPGPLLIYNNFLESTGENVMLGGGGVIMPGVTPSDVTITRNYFKKQLQWKGQPAPCGGSGQPQCYDVKDHFEIKNGQRVLVDSNVFDTAFQGAQPEFWIVNCFVTGPYVCQDVTYSNNLLMHGAQFLVIAGNGSPVTGARIMARNNVAVDINQVLYGSVAGVMQMGDTSHVVIDHNTIVANTFKPCGGGSPSTCTGGAIFFGDALPATNTDLTVTDNIMGGPLAANASNALATYDALMAVPGNNVSHDAWVGDITPVGGSGGYPAGADFWPFAAAGCTMSYAPASCYTADWSLVGFVNFAGNDYRLSAASPLHNAASDGTDVGAQILAVLSAINGVYQ